MLLTLYTHYVITIKKHLHNRIKIIEIEIKFHEIKLKLMIAITKSPTKDKIDKNIMALIIVQYYKILKKLS